MPVSFCTPARSATLYRGPCQATAASSALMAASPARRYSSNEHRIQPAAESMHEKRASQRIILADWPGLLSLVWVRLQLVGALGTLSWLFSLTASDTSVLRT